MSQNANIAQGNDSSKLRQLKPALVPPGVGINSGPNSGFQHGPTNLPPRPYTNGSPFGAPQKQKNIHMTAASRLPEVEARIGRLEGALGEYIDQRGQKALERSRLPPDNASRQR